MVAMVLSMAIPSHDWPGALVNGVLQHDPRLVFWATVLAFVVFATAFLAAGLLFLLQIRGVRSLRAGQSQLDSRRITQAIALLFVVNTVGVCMVIFLLLPVELRTPSTAAILLLLGAVFMGVILVQFSIVRWAMTRTLRMLAKVPRAGESNEKDQDKERPV